MGPLSFGPPSSRESLGSGRSPGRGRSKGERESRKREFTPGRGSSSVEGGRESRKSQGGTSWGRPRLPLVFPRQTPPGREVPRSPCRMAWRCPRPQAEARLPRPAISPTPDVLRPRALRPRHGDTKFVMETEVIRHGDRGPRRGCACSPGAAWGPEPLPEASHSLASGRGQQLAGSEARELLSRVVLPSELSATGLGG